MGPGGPGCGPASKKLDAVTTQMGLVWENGTRWDPGDNPDGTCVGRIGPGDDLDLVHFWICACHSCAGVFSVSFRLYQMVRSFGVDGVLCQAT